MCLSKRWIYSRSIWTDTGSHKSLLGMLHFVLLSVILASIVSIHTIIRIIIMELMIILMNRADPKRNKCYLNCGVSNNLLLILERIRFGRNV
jgi:hypothetical protein